MSIQKINRQTQIKSTVRVEKLFILFVHVNAEYECGFLYLSTFAGDLVWRQLEAVIALTQEGANQVVAKMLTRRLRFAFVHI